MNREVFVKGLDAIYAAQGKAHPHEKFRIATFERVEDLPDSFMAFAVEELKDFASLPQNLGRELRLVLWPAYRDKNPQLRAHADDTGCDACGKSAAGPGFFYVSEQGKKSVFILKCRCCRQQNVADWKAWSLAEMYAAGLTPEMRG